MINVQDHVSPVVTQLSAEEDCDKKNIIKLKKYKRAQGTRIFFYSSQIHLHKAHTEKKNFSSTQLISSLWYNVDTLLLCNHLVITETWTLTFIFEPDVSTQHK